MTPDSSGYIRSIEFVVMAVLGGLGSILGSIVGSAFLVVLPQALTVFHEYEEAVLGLIMIVFMIFLPGGIVPSAIARWRWRTYASGLLRIENVGISFGGVQALFGVTLDIRRGEIFAVIGPNGAGKTTLFNVISGLYPAQQGRVVLDGRDITGLPPHRLARLGLSRTFQNLQVFFRMSAVENVMVGRHLHEQRNVLAHMLGLPSVKRQNRQTREIAQELLALVGLSPLAEKAAGSLPYGALKRLEIARALAAEPRHPPAR